MLRTHQGTDACRAKDSPTSRLPPPVWVADGCRWVQHIEAQLRNVDRRRDAAVALPMLPAALERGGGCACRLVRDSRGTILAKEVRVLAAVGRALEVRLIVLLEEASMCQFHHQVAPWKVAVGLEERLHYQRG